MGKMLNIIRSGLVKALGIHAACMLKSDDYYKHMANKLIFYPRIFGDHQRLIVGQGVVLNDALINTISGRVVIKDNSFCGHGVSLITGTHSYDRFGIERQTTIPREGRDIVVEEGVWIGSNATVLGPCVIGKDTVIAAGAVVTGNIEGRSVYGGVPARKIKAIA